MQRNCKKEKKYIIVKYIFKMEILNYFRPVFNTMSGVMCFILLCI